MVKKCIIQLVKAPILGGVKTRMNPYLSLEDALSLHCVMAQQVHDNLLASQLAPVWLALSQETRDPWLTDMLERGAERCVVQQGRDLGERMADLVQQGFSYAEDVVLVGSDCPFIDEHYLQQAFQALASGQDLVFGAAHDGGYVLVGVSRRYHLSANIDRVNHLFSDIAWGTETVLAENIEQAKQLGLSHNCLSELSDIDRPEDLARLESFEWASRFISER